MAKILVECVRMKTRTMVLRRAAMVESLLWWLEMLLWRVVCLQSHYFALQADLKVEWSKRLIIEIGFEIGFLRNEK